MTARQLSAGAALEQVIRADLGEHVELDPREEAVLAAAAAQLDDVRALEADIRARGHVLETGLVNPSVTTSKLRGIAGEGWASSSR